MTKQSRCIIKFHYRPSVPLQIFHWSLISIVLLIAFIFQLEYTYLNWPTIAFLVLFVVLAFVESGRYFITFNFSENKIICYSLYKWFAKEENSTDLRSVVMNNKYVTFNFKDDNWCLAFKKNDRQAIIKLLKDQGIKVQENKNNDLFDQFFETK